MLISGIEDVSLFQDDNIHHTVNQHCAVVYKNPHVSEFIYLLDSFERLPRISSLQSTLGKKHRNIFCVARIADFFLLFSS